MATDMSLGGGAGFGAGYTPIQFAPLVSLTGPVMAPTTPAAPEAAAPLIRPPMMVDQGGGYETPQRTDEAFQNLQPIGVRLATPEGRAAELQNLGRAVSALMSPFTTIPSLALTGKTPMELMAGAMGVGDAQSAQATPQNPFANVLEGLRSFLFGPQQESVSLGGSSAGGLASQGLGMGSAVFSDAMNAALASGASEEAANLAGRTALGLFAQGMDPASAVALGSVTQISRNPFDMTSGQATSGASGMLGGTPAGNQLLSDIYGAMQFAPGSTETGPGGTSLSQEGSYEGSYGGGWGPGDTLGGYDTNTGAYSDVTGYE